MNDSAQSGSVPASAAEPVTPLAAPAVVHGTWFQRLSSVLFIIFCLELGLFLIVYPWITAWSDNYFAWAVPAGLQKVWNQLWNNPYFRGGVSGLGLANIWIALAETLRLLSRR